MPTIKTRDNRKSKHLNRKLRKLLSKEQSYHEQNYINWDTNLEILKKAVQANKLQWTMGKKDIRVFNE